MPTLNTIDTSTSATALDTGASYDVAPSGVRWLAFYNGSATELRYSTNQGATWTEDTTGGTLPVTQPSLFIDLDGYAHLVGMSSSQVRYYRGTPSGNSWSWSTFYSPLNASISGRPQVVAHREGTGWMAHIVWSRYYQTETGYYEYRCRCESYSTSSWESGCTPAACPSHGHTTYTGWYSSYPTCACGSQGANPPGCHTNQSGVGTHGCACNHSHLCASGSVESQFYSTGTDTDNYAYYARYSITSGGTITTSASATTISSDYGQYQPTNPVLDFNHTGDGKTVQAGQPDVFVAWRTGSTGGSNGVNMRKATYSAGAWNWGTIRTLDSTVNPTVLDAVCDGTRFIVAFKSGTNYKVMQRDLADTTTTTLASLPALESNVQEGPTMEARTDSLYLLGAGTTSNNPSYILYDRTTSLWGSWTTVEAVVNVTSQRTAKPSTASGSGRSAIEWVYLTGSGSPYTLRHWYEGLNKPPTTPTWTTTAGTFDVAVNLNLTWVFNDPDPGETQGAYTMRRRIGAGSYNYWNGSTWQASEDGTTKIASASTTLSLSSWGNDLDDIHYYSVKTWDGIDAGPSSWSTELAITPSAKDNPTITAPVGTVSVSSVTVTWTVATQTKYQVQVRENNAGSPGAVIYDSGVVASAIQSHSGTPFPTNGVTRFVEVTTWNDEGLKSDTDSDLITVDYSPPPTPLFTLAPFTVPAGGEVVDAGLLLSMVRQNPNLLDKNTAIFDVSTAGWQDNANTTIGYGDELLTMTPTVTILDMTVETAALTAVTEGVSYTARAWLKAVSTSKQAIIRIRWYDNGPTEVGLSSSGQFTASTQGVELSVTGTAPAGATQARILVQVLGPLTGQVWHLDDVALFVNDGTTNFRAGYNGVAPTYLDLYRRSNPVSEGGYGIVEGALQNQYGTITSPYWQWALNGPANGVSVRYEWYAMKYTPIKPFLVDRMVFMVQKMGSPTSPISFSVHEDTADGRVLATATLDTASLSTSWAFHTMDFSNGVILRPGKVYWFKFVQPVFETTSHYVRIASLYKSWEKNATHDGAVWWGLDGLGNLEIIYDSNEDMAAELWGYALPPSWNYSEVRLAEALSVDATYYDYTVASDVDYEYRVDAVALVNSTTAQSDWEG